MNRREMLTASIAGAVSIACGGAIAEKQAMPTVMCLPWSDRNVSLSSSLIESATGEKVCIKEGKMVAAMYVDGTWQAISWGCD